MELPSIVEALLTGSDEPLPAEELARLIRARVAEAEDSRARKIEEGETPEELPEWLTSMAAISAEPVIVAIAKLNHDYETTGRAFVLMERAKGWKLFTRPAYGEFVRQLFPGRKPERLSGPAMETLAIIAYRQPITKGAIEAVRGVACDGMLQKLLDRELVRIGGRAELPGRPLLYETTELFYEHFGIRSIDDLPNATELRRVKLPEAPAESTAAAESQLALSATDAKPAENAE
ncbi:SMC-Scp complex subunit ScpB [Haloferula sp. BvORR071]|uniref:SMC-Scp complex subunit ScpB n=1 Tax=Haloferula sp. BvORR071 TaxID=1396141 RepID=UPI00069902FE|nr:SMC-Scp complex subunit ScpB [Haloferula sp. BvORR071]